MRECVAVATGATGASKNNIQTQNWSNKCQKLFVELGIYFDFKIDNNCIHMCYTMLCGARSTINERHQLIKVEFERIAHTLTRIHPSITMEKLAHLPERNNACFVGLLLPLLI